MTASEYVTKWFPPSAYSFSLITIYLNEDTEVVRDIDVRDCQNSRLMIQIPKYVDEDMYLDAAWEELVELHPH